MVGDQVILVAEDKDDDIIIIRKALTHARVPCGLHFVRDGEQAIAYLKGEGEFSDRQNHPLPDLMLLDLKMPRKDGFEVLKWIRGESNHRNLRVIVLTSSYLMDDVNLAYSLGANSFLVKPADFFNFSELAHFLTEYWLRLDQRPHQSTLTGRCPPLSDSGLPVTTTEPPAL